jgi:hypothetical protein
VRWLTVLVAPVLAVGCGLGSEAVVEPGEAERLVLQGADLPGFDVSWSGGSRGRWTARYRRTGSLPLGIESNAEVAESSGGAGERLAEIHTAFGDRGDDWQPIDEPGLGEESFAFTRVRATARDYEVVWRDANVTGHLRVSGVDGELAFADALALAEKQERRIDDAKR